jgi:hypothetical protein
MQPGSAIPSRTSRRGDVEMPRPKGQIQVRVRSWVQEPAFLRPGRQACRRRYPSDSADHPRLR